ncbi:MAG: carbohydrate kinase [Chloroflexota bacterium]|nr:MAG: carbohydrate kinase [Chloroflexota bacterium]
MNMTIASLDLGTTHTKAGLFSSEGKLLRVATRKTSTHHSPAGNAYYDPGEIVAAVYDLLNELSQDIEKPNIAGLGIASMAETGLLIDRITGTPLTPLLPWFDSAAASKVQYLIDADHPRERFYRFGIRPNFKCAVAKLLWLQQEDPNLLENSLWLNTADYVAFILSGSRSTETSLAGRTYAFRIDQNMWDKDWLKDLNIPSHVFPPAVNSGQSVGKVGRDAASLTGLLEGTPVSICGHDHVCAAFAGIGMDTQKVFDSMGTAEALIGRFPKPALGVEEYQSGLVFGRYVSGEGLYWMGGLSSSGGSLDWLRSVLSDPPLSYLELKEILDQSSPGPTGIIYLPYLTGSGSPHTDIHARGAFFGLKRSHSQADLVKAILEGTAYEAEVIRMQAKVVIEKEINSITASGGGTNLSSWMMTKANVSGCTIEVPRTSEATLLGAALIAGIGLGIYQDAHEARSIARCEPLAIYHPENVFHIQYRRLFEEVFLPLQAPVRAISHRLAGW